MAFPHHEYRPDIHIHTTASDGVCTFEQIAARAVKIGLNILSVTDHDTLDAYKDMEDVRNSGDILILPGVEFSAGESRDTHILGYGALPTLRKLEPFLSGLRENRRARLVRMTEKLQGAGVRVTVDDVMKDNPNSPGRIHLARVLVSNGYAASIHEAFVKYLAPGRVGYEPHRNVSVAKLIETMRSVGAVPVLAHPGLLNMEIHSLRPLLSQWIDAGLLGMEVYHPSHSDGTIREFDGLAREKGLFITGGSDFHEPEASGSHMDLGGMLRYWKTADDDMKKLLHLVGL